MKDFIRHTNPHGIAEINQTINDIERQVHYLRAIGKLTQSLEDYYKSELEWLKRKLQRRIKNKRRVHRKSNERT